MIENDRTMCLKVYEVDNEVLVAVCDSDLLGRRFAEGKLQLEVSADFFGEERASAAEVGTAMFRATTANFVGEKAVSCAIDLEYVDEKNVLRIDGVPCAQMVRM